MKSNIILFGAALAAAAILPVHAATVAITPGTYSQNFDSLPTTFGSAEPAAGWFLRTAATANSMGSATTIGPIRAWNHTGGQFKHFSSTNIASTSDATAQNANTNRALGVRQVQSGNFAPGASFNFNFSTTAILMDSISIDLLMLEDQPRSSTFDIQYGLGASPSTFVTLGSWTDPGVFGSTTFTFDRSDFGSALDGQTQVWFRIAALSASTGTGIVYDSVAIDNFAITSSAVPEPAATLLGALGILGLLRRRR